MTLRGALVGCRTGCQGVCWRSSTEQWGFRRLRHKSLEPLHLKLGLRRGIVPDPDSGLLAVVLRVEFINQHYAIVQRSYFTE